MDSEKPQPPSLPFRMLLLVLSISTVLFAVLSLSGVLLGYICVIPYGLTFALLRWLGIRERTHDKQKTPGRAGRPGALGR